MSKLIKGRDVLGWGKLSEIPEKKNQFGLGYKPVYIGSQKNNQRKLYALQDVFHNVGYRMKIVWPKLRKKMKGYPTWYVIVHQIQFSTIGRPLRFWR